MPSAFMLPEALAHRTGSLLSVETPPQGMAFQVFILTGARGRFVLKVARTPAMVRALRQEARLLTALHNQAPFVAQPLGEAPTEAGQAFLFTYLQGEPLHLALQSAEWPIASCTAKCPTPPAAPLISTLCPASRSGRTNCQAVSPASGSAAACT